jgi:hypothetical protein
VAGSKDWDEETVAKYDIDQLLGKSVMIDVDGVESKGKVYQNIVAIEGLSEGFEVQPIREKVSVTVEDFAGEKTLGLPKWIQEKIAKSKEWQEMYSSPDMPSERNQQQPTFSDSQIAEAKERIREESDEIRVEDVPF